ncbi:hypothetical protein MHYP_G00196580, partial [Metynnis hypsauchen]
RADKQARGKGRKLGRKDGQNGLKELTQVSLATRIQPSALRPQTCWTIERWSERTREREIGGERESETEEERQNLRFQLLVKSVSTDKKKKTQRHRLDGTDRGNRRTAGKEKRTRAQVEAGDERESVGPCAERVQRGEAQARQRADSSNQARRGGKEKK